MTDERKVDERNSQRTSVYLVRRADALLGALTFFTVTGKSATHRRLQFLAQSDYWEWEMDNLIYSFTNMAERRAIWKSREQTSAKLVRLGLTVDAKLLRRAVWREERVARRTDLVNGHWKMTQTSDRIAPLDMLRQVIDEWNRAIDMAEKEFVLPMRDKARDWNIQSRSDLASLRRSMPTLSEEQA